MAIAFRSIGQVQVWSDAPSSTFSCPKPAGLTVGDFMLASMTTNGVSINVPVGWTDLYYMNTTSNPKQRVMYKVADSSDVAASTFDFIADSSTYGNVDIVAYSGVDTGTPIDYTFTPFESTSNVTSFTVTGTTTVSASTFIIGGAAANTGVGSSSPTWTMPSTPSAWIEEWKADTGAGGAVSASGGKSHVRGRCETALGAGASTGNITFTLSSGRAGSAWAVGLRPSGGGGGAPTPVLTSRIVGVGDNPTSARVKVRVSNASAVRLKVATDTGMTTGVVEGSNVTPDADGNAEVTVTGLTAGTKYFYRIVMTDLDDAEHDDTEAVQGVLRTAPVGATSFAVDFGSCTDSSDTTAFDTIAARDDDLFIHVGDLYYADGSGTSLSNFRSKFLAKLGATNHKKLFSTRPVVYTPSDHDGMNNNSAAGSDPTAWTNWNAAYREFFPTPTLPGGSTGVYYTFVWGRVRFIVTDGQSFKSSPAATDNSSKTYLGTTQKQWVKDTITAATEPLIVIVNNNPWVGAAEAGDDAWMGYTTERTEMANFYAASGKNIIMTGGDQHCLAADDGTNSPGGIPIMHAAPFNNTASRKGGPYSEGQYPASGSSLVEQYGRIVFTDTGSTISVDFTGYSADNTPRITMSLLYDAADPAGSASGSFTFTGSADGERQSQGAASGTFSFTGAANGSTPVNPPTMPVGDLSGDAMAPGGWKQLLAEDFNSECAEGSFLATYPGWFAYPDTWDNGHTSYYNGGNSVSVDNGILSIRIFTDGTGKHRTETLRPPPGQFQNQKYGIFEVAYRVQQPLPGYKQAFLLWPESNLGADGEIDFPEADFTTGANIKGFVHEIEPPGSHVNNAYSIDSGVDVVGNGWHVAQIRWHNDRVEFWLDGALLGTGYTSSVNVPDIAMGWRLQTEGNLTGTFADSGIDPATTGTVDIAYVAMYTPVSVGGASGSFNFAGGANGTTPTVTEATGSASGTFTFTGSANGTTPPDAPATGIVTGSYSFAGTAAGVMQPVGEATGSVGWVGTATGPQASVFGSAEGTFEFVAEVAGTKPLLRFEPPTHEEPIRTDVRPLNYYRLTYANSIVRVDGVFRSIRTPSDDLIEAAGEEGRDYFRGGRVYHITDEQAAELEAAGFPVGGLS